MEMTNLRDLFVHDLQDLYDAESQLMEALPDMANAATRTDLKTAFTEHQAQTIEQRQRLETIADRMGVSPKGRKKCKGMKGLIEEAEELIGEDGDPDTRDAALIAAAQKAEHYEIAGYGTARTYAKLLGDHESARLLERTLEEEGRTDIRLTSLAMSGINRAAAV